MYLEYFYRLIWHLAWISFCYWFGIIDLTSVFFVYPRFYKIRRQQPERRPPIPIYVVPEIVLSFENVKIKMAFLRLFKTFFRALRLSRQINEIMDIHSVVHESLMTGLLFLFRLYRKPPDKFYQVNNVPIQVRSSRHFIKCIVLQLIMIACAIVFLSSSCLFVPPKAQHISTKEACLDATREMLEDFSCQSSEDTDYFAFVSSPNLETESMPRNMGGWDSDSFPIVIDSATSRTITPFLSDLINPKSYESTLKGIGKGQITHVGTVRWKVLDVNGHAAIIEDTDAYCSKDAPYRLLCPHSWRQSMNSRRYQAGETEGEGATMVLDASDHGGYLLSWNRGKTVVEAPLDFQTNLPMIQGLPTYQSFQAFADDLIFCLFSQCNIFCIFSSFSYIFFFRRC